MEDNKSNQNSPKSLKKYIVIFFSIAIILLILAGVFQKRVEENLQYYKNELEQRESTLLTNQSMLENAQTENAYLSDKLKSLEFENQNIKDKLIEKNNVEIQNANEKQVLTKQNENLMLLTQVQELFLSKKKTEASEVFIKIDKTQLPEDALEIYDELEKKF